MNHEEARDSGIVSGYSLRPTAFSPPPYTPPMLILPFLFAAAAPTSASDICLAMVPPRLAAQIERDHSEYALPLLTDSPIERLLSNAEAGGWPCPFVAIADVDGDGTLDRAVVLKHKTQPTVRLVAARNIEGMWRIELQKDWPIAIGAAVVEPLEAGLYEQARAKQNSVTQNPAAQLDNLNSIQSDHAGFIAGQSESAKAAYFYQNGKWQELWIED